MRQTGKASLGGGRRHDQPEDSAQRNSPGKPRDPQGPASNL